MSEMGSMAYVYELVGFIFGVLACGIVYATHKAIQQMEDKHYGQQLEVNMALIAATKQSLESAVETLASVGIRYDQHERIERGCFKVPRCFWANPDNVELKAAALTTLVTNCVRQVHLDSNHVCFNLVLFFAKQARIAPGMVVAVTHEITKQAGYNSLLKGFFEKLPFADDYVRQYGK